MDSLDQRRRLETQALRGRVAVACLLVVCAVWATSNLPIYGRAIHHTIGLDPLALIGNDSGIGRGKVLLGAWISIIGLFCLVLITAVFRAWRSLLSLALIAITALTIAAVPLWFSRARDDAQWAALSKLVISTKPKSNWPAFSKARIPETALVSFDKLHQYATDLLKAHEPELQAAWGLSGRALEAAFYMNLATRMYEFGNRSNPTQPGCVGQNELLQTSVGIDELSEAERLKSRIGCCTDYAHLLRALLTRGRFENRLVEVPGHVFNEANIDGTWRALDATINVMYDRSWQKMKSRIADHIEVYWFPLVDKTYKNATAFRPIAAQFRIQMMMQVGDSR